MKKILVLLLTASFAGCGTTMMSKDLAPEDAQVSEVIETAGKNQADLYVAANSWAVDHFNSAESVIEFSDKEAGMVKGKYVLELNDGVYNMLYRSTLTIEVRDGKSRITIADPYYKATGDFLSGQYAGHREYLPMQSKKTFDEKLRPEYRRLIDSFKQALAAQKASW